MTSFFIETSGSTHTISDAEQMAGLLEVAKFLPVQRMAEADVVILHACPSNSISRLEEIQKEFPYKIAILSGCFSRPFKKQALVCSEQLNHIVEVVEESLHNNKEQPFLI